MGRARQLLLCTVLRVRTRDSNTDHTLQLRLCTALRVRTLAMGIAHPLQHLPCPARRDKIRGRNTAHTLLRPPHRVRRGKTRAASIDHTHLLRPCISISHASRHPSPFPMPKTRLRLRRHLPTAWLTIRTCLEQPRPVHRPRNPCRRYREDRLLRRRRRAIRRHLR